MFLWLTCLRKHVLGELVYFVSLPGFVKHSFVGLAADTYQA